MTSDIYVYGLIALAGIIIFIYSVMIIINFLKAIKAKK